jgi:hypothetical protein
MFVKLCLYLSLTFYVLSRYFPKSSDRQFRNVITSRAGASATGLLLASAASTTPTTTPIQVSSDEFTGDAEARNPLIHAGFCTS